MRNDKHRKYKSGEKKQPVDKGWEQMRALLETEMPQRRRRRPALLWIFMPVAAAFLVVWLSRRASYSPTPQPTPTSNSPAVVSPIASLPWPEDRAKQQAASSAPAVAARSNAIELAIPLSLTPKAGAVASPTIAATPIGAGEAQEPVSEMDEAQWGTVTGGRPPGMAPTPNLPVILSCVQSADADAPTGASPLQPIAEMSLSTFTPTNKRFWQPFGLGLYGGTAAYPWDGNFTGRAGLHVQYDINEFLGFRAGIGLSAYRVSSNHLLTIPGSAAFSAIKNTVNANSEFFNPARAEQYPAQIPLRWIYSLEAPLHAYVRIGRRWEFVTGAMYQRDQSVKTASEILLANRILDLDVSSRYFRINDLAANNVRLSRWVMHFGAGWNPLRRLNLLLYAQIPFSPTGLSRLDESDVPCLCLLSSNLASQKYENQHRLRPALHLQATYQIVR